jgi:hypothetical protein
MKNAVFWDVAPCRSCVNRRFRGTYRLHLEGRVGTLTILAERPSLVGEVSANFSG